MESNSAPKRSLSKRASMPVRPLDVRRILNDQGASEARPLPAEHVAVPPSPSASVKSGSSGRTSFQSHGRTMSLAAESMNSGTATPSRSNRFSMTFPIQPATREESPNRPAAISTAKDNVVAPEAVASPTGPTDSNFLTAIAAQERRVLEIKEELQRAEKDLDKLKRQWANHEAHKKKNDAKRVTKLQPLNTTMPVPETQEDEDGSQTWLQMEMERRKALLSGAKTSNRTVFSGSRHTRALSLLSPVQKTGPSTFPSHPPRKDSLPRESMESDKQGRPSYLSRASTTPDITAEVARVVDSQIDLTQANVDREALIKTGKKMATDFKDGLWTFWEDLRQATVGDEATQAVHSPQMQRQNSSQTIRSNSRRDNSRGASLRPSSRGSTASRGSTETRRPGTRSPVNRRYSPTKVAEEPPLVDVGSTSWNETSLPVKKPSSKHHKSPSTAPSTASSAVGEEAWDTWDDQSPHESRSSSATSEDTSSHTIDANTLSTPNTQRHQQASPTSTGGSGKKDPIPWPALSKLSPAATTLKRTASHLMNEWEKSLTPEPGQEYRGEDEGMLGFSAEAQALQPKKG